MLWVGDVIKFGRVPFIVKESSAQEGERGDDVVIVEENETMEKNVTEIESLDYIN